MSRPGGTAPGLGRSILRSVHCLAASVAGQLDDSPVPIVGTRRELNRAFGKSDNYTAFLERQAREGVLNFRSSGSANVWIKGFGRRERVKTLGLPACPETSPLRHGGPEPVKVLCDHLKIPAELPESLFDPAQCPDPPGMNQIIESIDRSAREGFAQAGISSILSHSQPPSHEEATTESKKVSVDEPKYLFRKNVEILICALPTTAKPNPPTIAWKGLEYYALLLKYPGKTFSAIDIIREVDGTVPPVEKARVKEFSRAGDGGPLTVRGGWTEDEASDELTVQEVEVSLQGLKEELAVAGESNIGIERVEELTLRVSKTEKYLNSIKGRGGMPRTLKSGDAREKARRSVSKAMGDARTKIHGSMPKLALFLNKYVEAIDYGFRYHPASLRPDWSF